LQDQVIHKKEPEKAILIGVEPKNTPIKSSSIYLDELEFLAYTAGATTLKRFIQRLEKPHPKTYIGEGKMEEITAYVKEHPKYTHFSFSNTSILPRCRRKNGRDNGLCKRT